MSRRTETRHALVGGHHRKMVRAHQLMVERLFQIHNTLHGIHVKELGRILGVRLDGVRNHLVHTCVIVVRLDAQYGRSEWRTLGNGHIVAVVLNLGCTIVDVLHQHRHGNLSRYTGHTVRCSNDKFVVLLVLIVELVHDVNGACV